MAVDAFRAVMHGLLRESRDDRGRLGFDYVEDGMRISIALRAKAKVWHAKADDPSCDIYCQTTYSTAASEAMYESDYYLSLRQEEIRRTR